MVREDLRANSEKNIWQIQEAKAKLSQLIEDTKKKGYQIITKNGEPIAVMLSKEEFDRVTKPTTSFLEFFKKAPHPEVELDIQRAQDLPRDLDI